jgi:hypothetical protein
VATNVILTNDGKYLLVAADNGIQVLDAIGAENGASSINKGVLAVPGQSKDHRYITVAVTPDDKFVLASLQFADQVGVFNLAQFLSTGDPSSAYIGSLNVGTQPVGLTVSPDGKTLYATDFVENNPVPGKLTVIDVATTTKGQQNGAIIATAHAGCQLTSRRGDLGRQEVWVTSMSNYVRLPASTLLTKPKKALIAKVKVGQWPIGIQLVSGSRLVISDNNGNDSSPTSRLRPDPGGGGSWRRPERKAGPDRLHPQRGDAARHGRLAGRQVPVRGQPGLGSGPGRETQNAPLTSSSPAGSPPERTKPKTGRRLACTSTRHRSARVAARR